MKSWRSLIRTWALLGVAAVIAAAAVVIHNHYASSNSTKVITVRWSRSAQTIEAAPGDQVLVVLGGGAFDFSSEAALRQDDYLTRPLWGDVVSSDATLLAPTSVNGPVTLAPARVAEFVVRHTGRAVLSAQVNSRCLAPGSPCHGYTDFTVVIVARAG